MAQHTLSAGLSQTRLAGASAAKQAAPFTWCSSFLSTAQPLACPSLGSGKVPSRRCAVLTVARATTENKPEIAKIADDIGLPTDEGLFGFKPFPEVWVGRLAMMGFITSVVEEFITGKGTLQQIGFTTPSQPLYVTLLVVFGGLTAFASARTLYRATNKQMTAKELLRYRQFLGIQREQQNIAEEQAKLKQNFSAGKDFTAPDNLKTIAQTKEEGTPADRVLTGSETPAQLADEGKTMQGGIFGIEPEQEAIEAANAMKRREQEGIPAPAMSLTSKQDVLEQSNMVPNDWNYAREVEITNGRWAMIGFLTAIIIEAATGHGILVQLISYAKALNLLGPASGVNL